VGAVAGGAGGAADESRRRALANESGLGENPLPPPSGWGWTGELTSAELSILVPVTLELVTRGPAWVNRRVESLTLIDERLVRQQLSVDFRFPTDLPGGVMIGEQELYFVPLLYLPRTDLSYFDVRDEEGRSLPLVTRPENARVTGLILIAAARQALREHTAIYGASLELGPGVEAYLATIPTSETRRLSRDLTRAILDPAQAIYPDPRVHEALLANQRFCDLLGLATFCSVIHLPLAIESGQRRVIKVSWEGRWGDEGTQPWTRLATWLGWRADTRVQLAPNVGAAESYHLQVAAPDSVELTGVGMRNARPFELIRRLAPGQDSAARPEKRLPRDRFQPFVGGVARRQHLYLRRSSEHRAGIAWIRMRASRHGFLWRAAATAWLVVVLLAAYWCGADEIAGESDTAAALLLLVPASVAGFLVRPGEHAMARHLLRGPRLLTALVAFIALAGAGLVLLVPEQQVTLSAGADIVPEVHADEALVKWLLRLAIMAAALAVALTVSAVLPRGGRREKTKPPTGPAEPFSEAPDHLPSGTERQSASA
jgi:hypothetical protein